MKWLEIMVLPNHEVIGVRHRWDVSILEGIMDPMSTHNPDTYVELFSELVSYEYLNKVIPNILWSRIEARN